MSFWWMPPHVITPAWDPAYPLWMLRPIWNRYRDRIYFMVTVAKMLPEPDAEDLLGRLDGADPAAARSPI